MVKLRRSLQSYWESRALGYGHTLAGVLYKSLPEHLNTGLNEWHTNIIKKYLLPRLPNNPSIADLACGYGRLSSVVKLHVPNALLIGADLSFNYCKLFQTVTHTQTVTCAKLDALPFQKASFDGILVITGLMYLEPPQAKQAVANILDLLKPDGHAIFIDPGQELIKALHLISPSTGKNSSPSTGFSKKNYLSFFAHHNFSILRSGSNPLFTLCLPLLWALRNAPKLLTFLIPRIINKDLETQWMARYAMHRWILIRRDR